MANKRTDLKMEALESMFDDIIFYGWKDEKESKIEGFLKGLPDSKDAKVKQVMDRLGEISGEFGEDQEGDWNGASERASNKLEKLLVTVKTQFKVK